MGLVGRWRECRVIGELLERAASGSGGVVVVVGPAGSGKTAMVDEAAANGRGLGFEVLRARPVRTQPGLMVWAQLLHDTGATGVEIERLLADPGALVLDSAARRLVAGARRLIVVDDVDHGGQRAVDMLSVIAGRAVAGATAVIATSTTPMGVGRELILGGLTEDELAAVIPEATHALWVASRGLPGVARVLAAQLSDGGDPIVALALHAESRVGFLVVDDAARTAYRTRLSTLDSELAEADRVGDADRGARIEAERTALLDELRRATGLGGRGRVTTTEAERARVNVTRTLRAALERISASAPRAGAHLQASIRTGLACRYQPAPGGPPRWHL